MAIEKLNVDDYNEIVAFVEKLKKNNVDINTPLNTQGSTILQICCLYTIDTSIIEYLLEQGASISYKDSRGWNAIDYTFLNQLPYAQILLFPTLKKHIQKQKTIPV